MNTEPYNDETRLTFGIHTGKRLIDIPGRWFLWYEAQTWANNKKLLTYIEENRAAFKLEK